MSRKNTSEQIRLDERNHVEKPLLDQLAGLDWEIIDLEMKQQTKASQRAMIPYTKQSRVNDSGFLKR